MRLAPPPSKHRARSIDIGGIPAAAELRLRRQGQVFQNPGPPLPHPVPSADFTDASLQSTSTASASCSALSISLEKRLPP